MFPSAARRLPYLPGSNPSESLADPVFPSKSYPLLTQRAQYEFVDRALEELLRAVPDFTVSYMIDLPII